MATRPETTKQLSALVEKDLLGNGDTRIYWAREVTFDYATNHAVRVDYMRFDPVNNTAGGIERGDFYCYEVKSSVEDFRSGHGHNMLGDYNYYVMPKAVFDEVRTDIPFHVGVYCPEEMLGGAYTKLMSVKKARRITRKRSASEMLLMMLRSANRENIKRKQNGINNKSAIIDRSSSTE